MSGKRRELKRLESGARSAGRGSALRKVARAGASRRKLQSLILILVTAGSVATALLAVGAGNPHYVVVYMVALGIVALICTLLMRARAD